MTSTLTRTVVYLNGHKLPFNHAFSWDKPPAPVQEIVNVIEDAYERVITIKDTYGEGTITCKGWVNDYSSEPQTWADVLQYRNGYSYYDTDTGLVVQSSTKYDLSDIDDGMLGAPNIPVEIRQTEGTTEVAIDSDGTYTMIAQKFRAHATDIDTMKIKARDVAGSDVDALNVQLWSDSSGPDAIVAGSSSVDLTSLTFTDGTGFADATWTSHDISTIMGTTHLTVGDYYWLVLKAAETDALYLNTTVNDRYSYGEFQGYSGSWAAVSGSTHLAFILQGHNQYGGHVIDIYEYNQAGTINEHWKCEGCSVAVQSQGMNPQQVVSLTLKFKTEQITLTRTV